MEELNLKQIEEVIKRRTSVRDYQKDWKDEELINKIISFSENINNTKGPFGTKINIKLLNKELNQSVKLGTYGTIKGASNYLVVSINKDDYNLFDLGYLFEKVVLYITSLNLGSVWMAGTYNKKQFEQSMKLNSNEEIVIVCPFGKAATKKSLLSNIISKSYNRKAFESLFFDVNLKPVDKNLCKDYIKVLEMVRLAPSSLNKQPWRMVMDTENGMYHFYNAIEKEKSDINIGIALSHFELMMNEQYIYGEVINASNNYLPNYKFTWKEKYN